MRASRCSVARDSAQAVEAGRPGQRRGGGDGPGHRRSAGRRQLSRCRPSTRRRASRPEANPYLDRARYGLYPPGSTFKVVTAMAALRKDPQLAHKTYECIRLPDGRVGNYHQGLEAPHPRRRAGHRRRTAPRHGARHRGLLQRLLRAVGHLRCGRRARCCDTANLLGIAAASPEYRGAVEEIAAAIVLRAGAGGGVAVPDGARGGHRGQRRRHAAGPLDHRRDQHPHRRRRRPCSAPDAAADAGEVHARSGDLRHRPARGAARVAMAGKTGTAELADAPSHAWFIGFAPYGGGGAQDRVLRTGGEWSVRRYGRGAGRGGDRQRRGRSWADPWIQP